MYIPQYQLENIRKILTPQKTIIIYGPRMRNGGQVLKLDI